jgi:hypothetical protein
LSGVFLPIFNRTRLLKRRVEIGPSLPGNPDLRWFPSDDPMVIVLTDRQPAWKPGQTRERVIMLDTTGKQAEADFVFGIGVKPCLSF